MHSKIITCMFLRRVNTIRQKLCCPAGIRIWLILITVYPHFFPDIEIKGTQRVKDKGTQNRDTIPGKEMGAPPIPHSYYITFSLTHHQLLIWKGHRRKTPWTVSQINAEPMKTLLTEIYSHTCGRSVIGTSALRDILYPFLDPKCSVSIFFLLKRRRILLSFWIKKWRDICTYYSNQLLCQK